MYCSRFLENHVLRLTKSFPIVLVTGARQVGKTTLLRHLASSAGGEGGKVERAYVSLDEFGPATLAQEDPDLFLQRHPPPLLIDEVQNAPGLLAALKPRVDQATQEGGSAGLYWLTGSQHFPLMKEVSESLAGRVAVVELSGLSQAEEEGRKPAEHPFRPDRVGDGASAHVLDVFERIVRGSFPRFVQADPPPVDTFYGSYLQTYLERDVRSMASIADLAAFRRFLRLAAARVGQLVNFSDLGRDVGVASSTISDWMSILEASYQIVLLRPYYANLGKRQVKTPKLYFRDTGVAAYLGGWTSAATASAGAMAGELLENYVVMEVFKSWEHRGKTPPLWFYRTRDGREVDLLIEEDGRLFPVEIKLTARPTRRDLKGIHALRSTRADVGAGAVVCMTSGDFPLDEENRALPVGAIG